MVLKNIVNVFGDNAAFCFKKRTHLLLGKPDCAFPQINVQRHPAVLCPVKHYLVGKIVLYLNPPYHFVVYWILLLKDENELLKPSFRVCLVFLVSSVCLVYKESLLF